MNLTEYARDVFSQSGEDGVIEKILATLPAQNKWCVEFGAWDGKHLSNTRNLIENANYSAVLIEADKIKFAELQNNYSANPNVIPMNAFVGFSPDNNLDTLLAQTPAPLDFDFLSIDIDGNDYHVWKACARYRPKLVCIEFNPTIPTEVHFVQDSDPLVKHGSSLRALVELGQAKQYELVAVSPVNAFFVDAQYFARLDIADNRAETLRSDTRYVTFLFSGYDGTVFLAGHSALPWHVFPLNPAKMQSLPRLLRKFPDDYNSVERWAFRQYRQFISPGEFWQRVRKRLARRARGA